VRGELLFFQQKPAIRHTQVSSCHAAACSILTPLGRSAAGADYFEKPDVFSNGGPTHLD
jgi:hypothetical protein